MKLQQSLRVLYIAIQVGSIGFACVMALTHLNPDQPVIGWLLWAALIPATAAVLLHLVSYRFLPPSTAQVLTLMLGTSVLLLIQFRITHFTWQYYFSEVGLIALIASLPVVPLLWAPRPLNKISLVQTVRKFPLIAPVAAVFFLAVVVMAYQQMQIYYFPFHLGWDYRIPGPWIHLMLLGFGLMEQAVVFYRLSED